MFDVSNDQFDFPVYYFGLAIGPFDARTDYTGKRSQAMQWMARERSIPRIFTLAKHLQHEMPLTLNEIALVLYYVRRAREDGQFLQGPTCECRMDIPQTSPELVLDAAATGLTRLPQAPGRGWRLTGGMVQSPLRPGAFQVSAVCPYEWAPPSVAYDGIAQALMSLTCTAALNGNSVALSLAFDDQPAWLFQQAQNQARIAIDAVTGGLAYQALAPQNFVSELLTPYQALLCFMVTHLGQTPPTGR